MIHKSRLFTASCFALITTAMAFAIRAGILTELGEKFQLNNVQLGWINSMAFLGFPIATIVGGLLYNLFGPRKLMWVAFICHVAGILLTIYAGGFWTLLISTFFIGFANGTVEAACNPMISDIFHDNQTTMLNRFHVWFPGGIVIGSLIAFLMRENGLGWQLQLATMLVPAAIYAWLIYGQEFPKSEHINTSTSTNIANLISPLYLFMIFCMTLTATTELGTQQWVEKLLGNAGAHPLLVLALVTGIMAVGRYFAGPVIHRLNPTGVLWASSLLATIGIGLMSMATGPATYFAAVIFALGVCYFWPTMLGFTSENIPKTGPLGMSLMGGAGMFATSMWHPVIGGWLDKEKAIQLAAGKTVEEAELLAGQATLDNLALFPAILVIAFGILYFYMKRKAGEVAKG